MKHSIHKKNMPTALTLVALACLLAFTCSCSMFKKEQKEEPKVDLSKMTPEERDNYLAIQRARERANQEIQLETANGKRNDANLKEKKKSTFSWVPHSIEKRERLSDDRPILLQEDSSIFEWRKGSGRRSEKLNENVTHPNF